MSKDFFEDPLSPQNIPPPDVPKEIYRGLPEVLESYVFISHDNNVFGKIIDSLAKNWDSLDSQNRQDLLKYLSSLKDAVQMYQTRYLNYNLKARSREDEKSGFGEADEWRREAHDSVLDALNILSRRMKEFGLSNSWRSNSAIYDITPEGTRDKVQKWALQVEFNNN